MKSSIVAAVAGRDGECLLRQRPQGKRYGGLWEFRGGKVLPAETFVDAARRDVREELRIEVEAVGQVRLSVRGPGSEFVIHFVDAAVNGAPQSVEHDDVA